MAVDFTRFQGQDATPSTTKEETQQPFEGISGDEQLKELEAAVERLKVLNKERKDPFDDDVLEVPRFCRCLENILRHQQKEKLTFWSERKDYFHYLTEGTSGLKALDNISKSIQGMTELVTSQGKGRALIRLCLKEQLLADCIQSAITNSKKTKDWYNPTAVLLSTPLTSRLVSALYDLSEMKFKLPVKDVNLEETWPSFVQKSFVSTSSTTTNSPQTKNKQGLFRSLNKGQNKEPQQRITRDHSYDLENAVEEKPSEIFVKQEIPFDIKVVSNLFSELRTILTDEFEGYTQESVLPEITVTKLDDITSSLLLLKEYITTMSEDITDNSHRSHDVIKELRKQLAETEKKLKESETITTNCKSQLKSSLKMVDSLKEEKEVLTRQADVHKREIASLNALNEQPIVTDEHLKDKRQLEETLSKLEEAHSELTKCTQALNELKRAKEEFEEDCKKKDNECTAMKTMVSDLRRELEELKRESSLEKDRCNNEIKKLRQEREEISTRLIVEVSSAKESHEKEVAELTEQVSILNERYAECEDEKESIKKELRTVQGLVEQETASLRFQLSTNSMQLQQAIEAQSVKESEVSDLKRQVQEHVKELSAMNIEKTKLQEQIKALNEQLLISETANKSIQDDLSSLSNQLTENTLNRDSLREESLKMQRDWDDQKERMHSDFQKVNQQVSSLTTENEDLRKALQKLLEQKVNLWQHADELEQEQVSKGIWIDSKVVTKCMDCQVVFTIFNRKHHCRSCGKVFCTPCCANKAQLPSNRDKVRVCRVCFNRINSLRTPHAASLVNTLEEEETEQSGSTVVSSVSEPISVFPGGVSLSDNSNLVHLTPLDGSDESLLQHVKELITTPHNNSKRVSVENSSEYSVEPLTSPPVTTNSYGLPPSDNVSVDPDDEFCVINVESNKTVVTTASANDNGLDIQTLQQKLASLKSSSNSTPNTSSPNQAATSNSSGSPMQNDTQEVDDLNVEGGGSHLVYVKVDMPRTVVSWQFSSQPRGIAMGLNYQETENGHVSSILPEKRVMSHRTILVGEYVAQKAGIYTIVFNNSHSKYSGRLLSYKVWKKYQ